MTRPAQPLGTPRPIRLALVLDAPALPAWAADVLGEASRAGTAVVVGAAVLGGPGAPRPPLGARLVLAADARRYAPRDDPARPVALAAALPGVAVAALEGGAPDADGAVVLPDASAVAAWGADVACYLGARPLAPRDRAGTALAPGGVWALDPPDGATGAGAMRDGRPATETRLCRVTPAGREVVARVRTGTHRISPAVNRAEHLRHVAVAAEGWLRRAARMGPDAVRGAGAGNAPGAASPGTGLPNVPPPNGAAGRTAEAPLSTAAAARLAVRSAARLVGARFRRGRAPRWQLAYHYDAGAEDGVPATDLGAFTRVDAPPGRYWADPFPVWHEGRGYVFFEEHVAGRADAHLSVADFDPARGLADPRVVLARDYHLSFPSVFAWDGAMYMTPEAATTQRVSLYRATRFPDAWAHVADLVAGATFVDPVVACLAGTWWLFVGVMPPRTEAATALHLYHAPSLFGPWTPHLLNPVAVDARTARPAGRVFARGGGLYRPVQDGAPSYGRAMTLRRIDALTPTDFAETSVARLEPDAAAGLVGAHTLNAAGGLTTADLLGPGSSA